MKLQTLNDTQFIARQNLFNALREKSNLKLRVGDSESFLLCFLFAYFVWNLTSSHKQLNTVYKQKWSVLTFSVRLVFYVSALNEENHWNLLPFFVIWLHWIFEAFWHLVNQWKPPRFFHLNQHYFVTFNAKIDNAIETSYHKQNPSFKSWVMRNDTTNSYLMWIYQKKKKM